MKPLVLTPGDPTGIGPEITCKALASWHGAPVVVVGDRAALEPWAERYGVSLVSVRELVTAPDGVAVLDPGDVAEPVEVASLRAGVAACLQGRASALVTGPIHKARLARRGFHHAGHTGFLGELCGVEAPVMAFVGGRVRVALCTVHLPLREVAEAWTTRVILHTVRAAWSARPGRIAVCGLNPHAGDEGLLGEEDAREAGPAVAAARAEGIDALGPISAEGAFRAALRGDVDWVVAAYHDQGLVALKSLDIAAGAGPASRSVNWTLGLPIVRVGVDHGTAHDIAGRGIADEGGMVAALSLAAELGR
ncbi:MAG: 4-hydroxythreonine-4-phosphate dehydrogenase PdxA [Alphaproteobacteria bacterium]|nr:4-hydroxythreonine-4-phosphate dehydrogenase PdxA [Alphaproteobacteria bacterium]MCB9699037.1 4-hydroxythreonine-4-phosphate dehydrogenase PdxA [Alphaproteobacteria bacterium]